MKIYNIRCEKIVQKWKYTLLLLFLLCFHFVSNATITKTIGATGDYTSITAAWAGISTPLSQPLIFEIKSDYNSASETFPINLTAKLGASSSNTITIRPENGVTALTITSSTTSSSLIKLNGCSYVTIDGRPGGFGTSVLTLENTSVAMGQGVVMFTGNATYNTLTYNTLLNGGQTVYGAVTFMGVGNNNNNNTISYCDLTKSTGGSASTCSGIRTYSGTADNTTVTNCNIYNYTTDGINVGSNSGGIGTGWTITYNSFYNTSASYSLTTTLYGIQMGTNSATGNNTITGNYFGGQSANCGGSALNLTCTNSSYSFTAIKITSNSGTVNINSNTIQNIALTQSTSGGQSAGVVGISTAGTSNFTIGTFGSPNIIGNAGGTGSITVTGTVQADFNGINMAGTGNTNSIAYNILGAISVTATSGVLTGIKISGTGGTTVSNNTIGNTTASNMLNSGSTTCYGIYFSNSTGGIYTCNNNLLQMFSLTNTGSNTFYGITTYTSGNPSALAMTCQNNTIQNISQSNGSGMFYGISVYSGKANSTQTISNNTIQAINFSTGSFSGFWIDVNASTISVICNSNTIGSTTANSISSGASSPSVFGIYFPNSIGGIYTVTGNTIQNFNFTGTGSGGSCYGIGAGGTGTGASFDFENNIIQNIVFSGVGTFYGLYGRSSLANSSNVISSNNINTITTGSSFTGIQAIANATSITINCNSNTIGSTSSNNITATRNTMNYAIYFSNTGTITCDNNTIQQFNLTSTLSGNAFSGISQAGGVMNSCQNNVIKNISCLGGSQNYGVYVFGTSTVCKSNTIQDFTCTSTMSSTYGIYASISSTATISGNTIGSSTTNNMNVGHLYGIYTTSSGSGVFNVYNNTIQQFTGNGFEGLYIAGSATGNYYSNSIKNLTTTGTTYGIYASTSGSSPAIYRNTIGGTSSNNISCSLSGTTLRAIYLSGSAGYICRANTIQQIYMSNSSASATGIYSSATSNHWIDSNIVSNVYATSTITGIEVNCSSSITVTIDTNTIGSTASNNFTSDGNTSQYGINISNSGTNTNYNCRANTFQQVYLNPSFGTGTNFYAIYVQGTNGANIQNNVVKDCTIKSGNNTFPGNALIAINNSPGSASHTISNNTFQNLTITAGLNTPFLTFVNINTNALGSLTCNNNSANTITCGGLMGGFAFQSTATVTCNSNTIGNSTSNNITFSGNGSHYGIYLNAAGTLSASSNQIQNVNLSSTGTNNAFSGIHITSGSATLTSNSISNISSSSKRTNTTGILDINGIYLATGGNTLNRNTISTMTMSSSGGSYCLAGVNSNNGSGTNAIKKTKITGLGAASTTSTTIVAGIFLQGTGSSDSYNNIVLLDNGSSSGNSITLNGIRNVSTGITTLYHNTVKIYGTTTSNNGSSAAYRNGALNSLDLRNNIFQNIRTNSGAATGKHYAIQYATIPTTVAAENYNYLEASGTGGHIGQYSSDQTTLASWKTASGTGAVDYTASINIGTDGKVTNGTVNDVLTNGDNLNTPVPDDYEGTSRPPAPTRGAFEYIVLLPVELIYFDGIKVNENNQLFWTTATEINNDFFTLEKTKDGINFETVCIVNGSGSTSESSNYLTYDYHVEKIINYYRLKQTDYDGESTYSDLISIDNRTSDSDRKIIQTTNLLGQEIPETYKGLVIIYFSDGSSEIRMQ